MHSQVGHWLKIDVAKPGMQTKSYRCQVLGYVTASDKHRIRWLDIASDAEDDPDAASEEEVR
eukprot:SAG31_NODE_16976_length_688_cov_0.869270_2_plen_62_part_00